MLVQYAHSRLKSVKIKYLHPFWIIHLTTYLVVGCVIQKRNNSYPHLLIAENFPHFFSPLLNVEIPQKGFIPSATPLVLLYDKTTLFKLLYSILITTILYSSFRIGHYIFIIFMPIASPNNNSIVLCQNITYIEDPLLFA